VTSGLPGEDKAQEGLEHLQGAAIELIGALRAFLDVAEELVREPAAVASLVRLAGSVARPPGSAGGGPDGAADGAGGDGGGVERIPVDDDNAAD
jgi:hypothetical protein